MGFNKRNYLLEFIIIVLKSQENMFTQTLKLWCDYKVRFSFVAIPDEEDSGTVGSLKYLKDKIKVGVLLYLHLIFDNCVIFGNGGWE